MSWQSIGGRVKGEGGREEKESGGRSLGKVIVLGVGTFEESWEYRGVVEVT